MSMQDYPAGTTPDTVQPGIDTLPIYEVARELGLAQHVMRMWETRFPQLRPLRGQGGRRYYRAHDIAVLRQIADLLYVRKLSLGQAQTELAHAPPAVGTAPAPALTAGPPVVEHDGGTPVQSVAAATPPAVPQSVPSAEPAPLQIEADTQPVSTPVVEEITIVQETIEYTAPEPEPDPEVLPPEAPAVMAVQEPVQPVPVDTPQPAAAQEAEPSPPVQAAPVSPADTTQDNAAEVPLEQLVMIELERLQAENTMLRDSLRGVLVELQALREMVPV
ncbi:MerR family transcriptional regulator [Komagataeibacter sp. FNDCF1]|uniref:MerR family transcriptional regulator n=1 Tax=Komagataeibacter sp. FNDCF1 TaxID=2878681 RepID=UPI001E571242|nr:MerR family transcriptional regulator [Komagataeibacter sp. FNDCF1]MCE2564250.1 MerR family transcriptional regulator [Komagataeibacter sp. FNDCF1]